MYMQNRRVSPSIRFFFAYNDLKETLCDFLHLTKYLGL